MTAYYDDSGINHAEIGINQAFQVCEWNQTTVNLIVNSSEVIQQKTQITLSAERLINGIELLHLPEYRIKQITSKATQYEQRLVSHLVGKLCYIGITVPPLASFSVRFYSIFYHSLQLQESSTLIF